MQRQLTDVEVAWLAGLYEGEGTAWCRHYVYPETGFHRTAVRVSIAMTDRDIVERVDAMFPSPSGIKTRRHQTGLGYKPLYYWNVSRRERVAEFLRLILPYLGERRTAKATEVLALAEDSSRGLGSQHRKKTHCPQGHPYDEKNTYVSTTRKGGINRQCRICRTAAWKRSNAKRQAAKKDRTT